MSERFYSDQDPVDGQIRLTGGESHHVARVSRKTAGDKIAILNGRGTMYSAEIVSLHADAVVARVLDETINAGEWPIPLILGVAMPKGDRADWLVEKAVEVGVSCLVPLRAKYGVVDARGGKLDRLRKRVVEASKQAGRSRLMDLREPSSVESWFQSPMEGARFIALPGAEPPTRKGPANCLGSIVLAVGPEGGFSESELRHARDGGWTPVGLGPTILRVETAAIVGCALLAQTLNP